MAQTGQAGAMLSQRGLRILALDGGGVRGLSTLMVLEYLMKSIDSLNPPKPCEIFDLIGGTSTGGLIAIMLARLQMTVEEAIDTYLDLSKEVFAAKHSFNFIATMANVARARGYCDTKALEREIKNIIKSKNQEGAQLMEANPTCKMFVCSLRRELGEAKGLVCFRNYNRDGQSEVLPKIWEAGRATSAAPTFFDPIQIGKYGEEFVDGGIGYNCPVDVAYKEAKACWNNPPRDFQCIVSIGTGKGSLKPFGSNLIAVGKTLLKMATDADEIAKKFADNHPELVGDGTQTRYFRFQVQRGMEDIGMAEHKMIKYIAAATKTYMQDSDEQGSKQLLKFKTLLSGTLTTPNYKLTSIPLDPAQTRYVERHYKALNFRGPGITSPSGHRDFSCGVVSFPKELFSNPEAHRRTIREYTHSDDPPWLIVLRRFCDPHKISSTLYDVPIHEAVWCDEFGGCYAIEIPTTHIWRIIASGNPAWTPDTDTLLHIQDLWMSVAGILKNKPLLQMAFRAGDKITNHFPLIPSEEYASAVCGIGGFSPDRTQNRAIFASEAERWEKVKQPMAFAFTLLPIETRCYFAEQYKWLSDNAARLLAVTRNLWNHADAIDLDSDQVPVKVKLRELESEFMRANTSNWAWLLEYTAFKIAHLETVVSQYFASGLLFEGPDDFIEIEDAVNLLINAGTYKEQDFQTSSDNCESEVMTEWWGHFGKPRARWVALWMTMKMLLNLSQCCELPEPFSVLLNTPSSTCYVV